MSTDYLKTFVAVSECNSLAVSRVHKSQGAISTRIAKLEEQAGIKLIDRSQRHFRLRAGLSGLDFPPAAVLERK